MEENKRAAGPPGAAGGGGKKTRGNKKQMGEGDKIGGRGKRKGNQKGGKPSDKVEDPDQVTGKEQQNPNNNEYIVDGDKNDEAKDQLTRALLESPLAKMGLHPAYLLGLKPLPWEREEQRMAAEKRQEEAEQRKASLRELQTVGWPGQAIAMNPYSSAFNDPGAPPRWPFIPETTVPGYVFEGAEFWNDQHQQQQPGDNTFQLRAVTKIENPPKRYKNINIFKAVATWVQQLMSTCGAIGQKKETEKEEEVQQVAAEEES